MPQLSNATLAGTVTQSTFTLEQPRGQFSHPSISDFDAIWLVVAHGNGGCCRGQACEMGRGLRGAGVGVDGGGVLGLWLKGCLLPGGMGGALPVWPLPSDPRYHPQPPRTSLPHGAQRKPRCLPTSPRGAITSR